MRFIIFGIIALLILFLVGQLLLKVDAKALARHARPVGLGVALVLAIVLFLTGRWGMAQRVLAGAFGFLGSWGGASGSAGGGGSRKGASRVRTALFDMELDHATGEMHGRVVSGQFAGKTLDTLDPGQRAALYRESVAAGDQSEAVFAAWLDRHHSGWRDDAAFGPGRDERWSQGQGAGARSSSMSHDEACEILGLEPGAGDAEIREAHKRLMMKYHPDQGGSDYLASKINEAKDVLLGK